MSGAATLDRVTEVTVSSVVLPLPTGVSDAKVLTGRQQPMTEVAVLFAEITAESGLTGLGLGYSKRAGGPGQFAHARELCPVLLGADPSDIAKIWDRLMWAGASVGRGGLAVQAIAAFDIALWDLKAKRAGLPLAKLLGAHRDSVRCYNTTGGFLHLSIEEVLDRAAESLARGIGGVKLKVGHPDSAIDLARVTAVREKLGDRVPLMVDANQQWDRATARRMCRALDPFGLAWIEEPLDAFDFDGHARLVSTFDTPIATGEMLTSAAEHARLIGAGGADIVQPDAPRIGGITQFLKEMALADSENIALAPHFAMEVHVHLAAAYPRESWVEHFEWFDPLFDERMTIADGRMHLSARPGLGVSLSDRARAWTVAEYTARA
ncbi:galactarate dehydratase /L-talarate dehydratase [Nocardia tenerifensis]|uniref:Galactarate dehydratase /L-talarate dehydratase n=2 Tax=Nocardia tenerifensis TaxID=228006 RepID=A0A318JNG4_9NOCA|nr:mandelate racemase/muconate lactonizing enzyme family protein [Nocardia tenerifensis]PXX52868.1 galactarate dehydratase /L-talarate dehydratase [Nocardia tenerifensis]